MEPTIRKTEIAAVNNAENLLRSKSGAFRTGEAIKAGIHPRTLYAMHAKGVIERLGSANGSRRTRS